MVLCPDHLASYLLLKARDSADHAYGCKSPTLEAVAMALPFLCCPEKLVGKKVLLLTDCEVVVYGWDARKVANDQSASIILRTIHIIAAFLGCWVMVRHLPRISTPSAKLADRLRRKATTTKGDLAAIAEEVPFSIPTALTRRLAYPSEDWSLPNRLLASVKERLHCLH
jgi:hypothetical protein